MNDKFHQLPELDLVAANDNHQELLPSSRSKQSFKIVASRENTLPEVHICLQLVRHYAGELTQLSGRGHTIIVPESEVDIKQTQIAQEVRGGVLQMLNDDRAKPGQQRLMTCVFREFADGMCGPRPLSIPVPRSTKLTAQGKKEISRLASCHVLELLAARNNFRPHIT